MALIPDKLTDFRVYDDGNDLIGVADIDLPDFEADSDEIKGAGIAGTLETPALGQMKSMTIGLSFRTITTSSFGLLAPKTHPLTLYGSIQFFDGGSGEIQEVPCKIYASALPKKKTMGKFDSAKKMDSKMDLKKQKKRLIGRPNMLTI